MALRLIRLFSGGGGGDGRGKKLNPGPLTPAYRPPPPPGTLIGCLPNNFMAARAGDHLSDLHSLADLYNPRMIALGLLVGCVALVPVWWKHRHDKSEAARRVKAE